MNHAERSSLSGVRVRDARTEELDELARLLAEVYGAFRTHLPADAWNRYIGEIVDVRGRLGESELIVAAHAAGSSERSGSIRTPLTRRSSTGRTAGPRFGRSACGPRHAAVASGRRSHASACGARRRAGRGRSGCTPPPTWPRLYERLGFRRAPEFDFEIGEMFTGRSLPPGESWQAQAHRLDLEEA